MRVFKKNAVNGFSMIKKLWNTIPEYIKNAESVATFKTKLKTLLFKEYFHSFLFLTFF